LRASAFRVSSDVLTANWTGKFKLAHGLGEEFHTGTCATTVFFEMPANNYGFVFACLGLAIQ
jgi:hypothetical protein